MCAGGGSTYGTAAETAAGRARPVCTARVGGVLCACTQPNGGVVCVYAAV